VRDEASQRQKDQDDADEIKLNHPKTKQRSVPVVTRLMMVRD